MSGMQWFHRSSTTLAVTCLLAAPAIGQDTGEGLYEDAAVNTTVVHALTFVPVSSGVGYQPAPVGPGYYALTTPFARLEAPLNLDPGTEVTRVCVHAYDADPGGVIIFYFIADEMADATHAPFRSFFSSAATGATPGYTLICGTPSPPVVIQTEGDLNGDGVSHTVQYALNVFCDASNCTSNLRWGAAFVRSREP